MKRVLAFILVAVSIAGCTSTSQNGTLAELRTAQPTVEEVYLEDSLEMAEQSYRRYLEETPKSATTPEAMRRLADLQIEKEFGIIGDGKLTEMAAPEPARRPEIRAGDTESRDREEDAETDLEFERRASGQTELLPALAVAAIPGPDGSDQSVLTGPRSAIQTYEKILASYPTTSGMTRCSTRCPALTMSWARPKTP